MAWLPVPCNPLWVEASLFAFRRKALSSGRPNVGIKPQRVSALSGLDDQLNYSLAEACESTEPPACRYPIPCAQQQTAWCRSFQPPAPGLDLARHAPSKTRLKGEIHRPVFLHSALTSALASALVRSCLCVNIFPLLHSLTRKCQFAIKHPPNTLTGFQTQLEEPHAHCPRVRHS